MNAFHLVVISGVGILLFVNGIRKILKGRLLANIPRSKIRSVAMGLAEISGLVKMKYPIKSPITYSECAFYKFLIEEEVSSGRGGRYWAKLSEGMSTTYYLVDDTTGQMLVDPMDAEVHMVPSHRQIESKFLSKKRYTEWILQEGDYAYILGQIKKQRNCVLERKEKLLDKIRELKKDKERLAAYDTDGDGMISPEEWDKARVDIERQLLEEDLKNVSINESDLVIGKGSKQDVFILSNCDEQSLCQKLNLYGWSMIIFGIIILSAIAVFFIYYPGLLRKLVNMENLW